MPVGTVCTSWGGCRIESWIPATAFEGMAEQAPKGIPVTLTQEQMDDLAKHVWDLKSPAVIANAMLEPLVGYGLRGFVWYQGESNVGDAAYEEKMETMIRNWREKWGRGDIPACFSVTHGHGRVRKTGRGCAVLPDVFGSLPLVDIPGWAWMIPDHAARNESKQDE